MKFNHWIYWNNSRNKSTIYWKLPNRLVLKSLSNCARARKLSWRSIQTDRNPWDFLACDRRRCWTDTTRWIQTDLIINKRWSKEGRPTSPAMECVGEGDSSLSLIHHQIVFVPNVGIAQSEWRKKIVSFNQRDEESICYWIAHRCCLSTTTELVNRG